MNCTYLSGNWFTAFQCLNRIAITEIYMPLFELLPILSLPLFLIITISAMIGGAGQGKRNWIIPAILFISFLIFSLYVVATEGLLGFWPNHTQNGWGNQVWFDLLLAIGIAWVFILPRAKVQNMRLPLWLIFICCSGCIGVLAMISRLFWLENKASE